jgi:uncharacterized protein YkwD
MPARKPFLVAAAALAFVFAAPAAAVTDGSDFRDGWVRHAPPAPKRVLSSRASDSMDALEAQVLADVNALRRSHGLRALRISTRLTAAADTHSRSMARRGFFSHDSADGSSFSKRIERYYRPSGYRYWSVGENLLWASPNVDSASALKMWLNSPPHRANLLFRGWREIGLSAVHVENAPGAYAGQSVTIVTADFGVRR